MRRLGNCWQLVVNLLHYAYKSYVEESFCLTSTETRLLIRDGDWRGGVGGGGERVKAQSHAPTRKTKEAVDRRQNNKNVKAVSPRHCAAACVPRNCCLNCREGQSHKDNVRSSAVSHTLRGHAANVYRWPAVQFCQPWGLELHSHRL